MCSNHGAAGDLDISAWEKWMIQKAKELRIRQQEYNKKVKQEKEKKEQEDLVKVKTMFR